MKKLLAISLLALLFLVSCASGNWIQKPYTGYDEKNYVCAVGQGKSQEEADLNARTELASLFGLAVDSTVSRTITESSATNGTSSSDFYAELFIVSSEATAKIDNIYGVEIAKRSAGKNGVFHSLAVMEKSVTRDYYKAQRESTKEAMKNLEKVVESRIGTFEAVEKAAELVKAAAQYNTETAIYNYLSGKSESYTKLDSAKEIYRKALDAVVLEVNVTGDTSGSVKSAVSHVFTSNGFKIANSSLKPTATVTVDIVWQETKGTGAAENFIFAEHTTDVSFIDNTGSKTVMVYYTKGKEGHQNIDSAKTRCLKKLVDELDLQFREAVEGRYTY